MNLGTWLDTAIGVALFFLAMSFLVSAVVEAISQIMAWRAKTLREGIASLLGSVGLDASATSAGAKKPGNALWELYNHSLMRGLFDYKSADKSSLLTNLLNGKLPSYVPSATFANAFLDLVTRNGAQQALTDALRMTNEAIRVARDATPGKPREAASAALKQRPDPLEAALRKAISEVPVLYARTRSDAAARLEALTAQRAAAATAQDAGRVALLDGQRHLVTGELARLDGEVATTIAAVGAADYLNAAVGQIDALRNAIAAKEADADPASWTAKMAQVEVAMAAAAPAINRVVNLLSDIASPVDRAIDDAQAIIAKIEQPELRATLQAMLGHSQAGIDDLRKAVAGWFDTSMDRVSGWYKRRVQLCGFIVGLLVAIAINADAINVVSRIAADETLRARLVTIAEKVENRPEGERQAAVIESGLKALPVGWYLSTCVDRVTAQDCHDEDHGHLATPRRDRVWQATSQQATWADALDAGVHLHWSLLSILGWIITAMAVKLGAPFWFDLMSSLLKVRAAGKVPARSDAKDATTGGGAAP